jgi:hypothetical protein
MLPVLLLITSPHPRPTTFAHLVLKACVQRHKVRYYERALVYCAPLGLQRGRSACFRKVFHEDATPRVGVVKFGKEHLGSAQLRLVGHFLLHPTDLAAAEMVKASDTPRMK